jgi:hypothetical protein
MTAPMAAKVFAFFVMLSVVQSVCLGQTVVDTDFSKGDFAALGWKAKGDWDIHTYPKESANNPGAVARFAANKPEGTLTKTFEAVQNPKKLTLSIDYGWGWGDITQGADSSSFMLLDAKGNGYAFKIHRVKANWAVQWSKVAEGTLPSEMTWASDEIDASHPSVREGGGLSRLSIVRKSDGTWSFHSKDWNQGAGATVLFTDETTSSFSQLVLLGTKNFDEQVFNKIVLSQSSANEAAENSAIPVTDFLNSIGVVTTFPDRGQPLPKTVEMVKFGGFRWVRGGTEGLTNDGPTTLQTYLDLHKQTGVRFCWGLVSGGSDLKKLIETSRPLADAGALLAFEGNNEPNNWGVTYQNEKGGDQAPSWLAVAKLQRDLCSAVKSDPVLKKYPVWSISESGAESDNVGLQFLTIPKGAGTLLPEGTQFADSANVHNYIYHPNSANLQDNKTWNAADPTAACKIDGLFGNHGVTWGKHFRGYSEAELMKLPKVTTETGSTIGGPITEEIQGLNLLSMYLDQFKRGWSHTAVYLLRDRADEGGNQSFGFFKPDYTPRKAATYLHNLTAILADQGTSEKRSQLNYTITKQPATMHDLLLQKSDGTLELVIWNERLKGTDEVTVSLGRSYSGIKVYDPTIGTEPIQTYGALESLKLSLSDHPLIISIPQ